MKLEETSLTRHDFKFLRFPEDPLWGYFSFRDKKNKIEICLEMCMGGFDVAVYDLNQNLLMPKECTDLKVKMGATEKAIEIANKLYRLYLFTHSPAKADG